MQISRNRLIAIVSSVAAALILIVGVIALRGNFTSASDSSSSSPLGGLTSPFTGEPVASLGPELIFKIDNVAQARPPTGLNQADIVYLLPVDGGLSRIYAVFSSHIPSVVGPVRSARQEDIELNQQFGTPAFAFSGAQPNLLPVIERSRIIDLYSGRATGYYRDNSRIAPYNLYANTSQLLAQASGASTAHDIGFTFGAAPAGGAPASSYSVAYPAAAFTFRWSAAQGRWLAWMDGAAAADSTGRALGGPTVVIQYVKVTRSVFKELGVEPPYANTVGSGSAVVLRNGQQYQVHWSRPNADSGTTFTLANGQKMPFARGQVWVVFAYGTGSVR